MSEKWDIYADWNPWHGCTKMESYTASHGVISQFRRKRPTLISVLVVTLSPRQRIHPIGKKAIITIEAEIK